MKYIQLKNSCAFPDITDLNPFRCVLVIEDTVSEVRQAEISKWLVESGCLYMMAWGEDCGSWDTSVDTANFEAFDWCDIPDEKNVVTTWHESEPLSEVFWFSKNNAIHGTTVISNTLILHLCDVCKKAQYELEYKNC